MLVHGPLVRWTVEKKGNKFQEVSIKNLSKKYNTLLIDAVSLYQEASFLSNSLRQSEKPDENLPQMSTHGLLNVFFKTLLDSKQKATWMDNFHLEVVFSSVDSFNFTNTEEEQLVDHEPCVIGGELALYAWESISSVMSNFPLSKANFFFSNCDTFSALLQRVTLDEKDLCSRLICSRDPRFRCTAMTNQVATNLFSAVMSNKLNTTLRIRNADITHTFQPTSWALLRVTDMALREKLLQLHSSVSNLSLVERAESKTTLSMTTIEEWVVFLCSIGETKKINENCTESCSRASLDGETGSSVLSSFFCFLCPTEFSRFSGTLAVCHKIPQKIMSAKWVNPFQYHYLNACSSNLLSLREAIDSIQKVESNETAALPRCSNRISFHQKTLQTKCFSRCLPIRVAFLKSCSCTSSSSLSGFSILEVLQVTGDDSFSTSPSFPVLDSDHLNAIEIIQNPAERVKEIALQLLKVTNIFESQKIDIWKSMNPVVPENSFLGKREANNINDWMEFECSLLHIYLSVLASNYTSLRSFPLLGEYCFKDV